MSAPMTVSAWQRFDDMRREIHEWLVGAAQCRNHLRAILAAEYDEPLPAEAREDIQAALERLERVGI